MDRTAYVDESEPDRRADPGVYLLAAAVVPDPSAERCRGTMSGLLLPGQHKVHWNREPDRHQLLAEAVGATDSAHLLIVRTEIGTSSERRRRLCLERLLHELEALGVHRAVMEARQTKQNAKDVEMLNALRNRKVVSRAFRVVHTPGPKEPLLWMADIVAGSYGAYRRGRPAPFEAISRTTTVHC